jgi:hypothetical protein
VCVSDYSAKREFHDRRGLHLLYHLPKGWASVSAFSAVTEKVFTNVYEVADWKHEITHDSCWRDISTFARVYFGLCENVNDQRQAAGLKPKAPALMTEHNSFQLFGRLFDWIPVEVTTDPTDDRNYRKLVRVIA